MPPTPRYARWFVDSSLSPSDVVLEQNDMSKCGRTNKKKFIFDSSARGKTKTKQWQVLQRNVYVSVTSDVRLLRKCLAMGPTYSTLGLK